MMGVLNVFLMVLMAATNVVSAIMFFGGGQPIFGMICLGLFVLCVWLGWQAIEEDF